LFDAHVLLLGSAWFLGTCNWHLLACHKRVQVVSQNSASGDFALPGETREQS